jgi:hypothetical protein
MNSKRNRRGSHLSKMEAHPSMSAPALVTLASAIAALIVLALPATAAQSAGRHNRNTIAPSVGKTWLKLDKGTAAALSDAGVKVEATEAAVGPTAKRPYFAFPIVGGKVDKDPPGGRIVLRGVDAKLFEGGLLMGEATVIAKYGDDHKGEDNNDR